MNSPEHYSEKKEMSQEQFLKAEEELFGQFPDGEYGGALKKVLRYTTEHELTQEQPQ
jgi:hypothetical protein